MVGARGLGALLRGKFGYIYFLFLRGEGEVQGRAGLGCDGGGVCMPVDL